MGPVGMGIIHDYSNTSAIRPRLLRIIFAIVFTSFSTTISSCNGTKNTMIQMKNDQGSSNPLLKISGRSLNYSTLPDLRVSWAEFDIENLADEPLVVQLQKITCQVHDGKTEIEKYILQERQNTYPELDPMEIEIEARQVLPIVINFDPVEGSDRASAPVNVEIEIVFNDSTYHGVCPVTLSRRIPKRNR
jgi:hypothetical protein